MPIKTDEQEMAVAKRDLKLTTSIEYGPTELLSKIMVEK